MRELPIIMGADSVRAILDGRKTQTRRVVNKKALDRFKLSPSGELFGSFNESNPEWVIYPTVDDAPYRVGDRLWVKETWGVGCRPDPNSGWVDGIEYKADESYLDDIESLPLRVIDDQDLDKYQRAGWNSPMFMPRWASRITLEITDIRVDRLQDITEDDALAEGIISNEEYEARASEGNLFPCPRCKGYQVHEAFGYDYGITEVDCNCCDTQKKRYRIVWDSLNAKRGYPWESNPWVWVVSFKVGKV